MKMKFLLITFFTAVSVSATAAPTHDVTGKKPGDIISPLTDDQIAAWCDFNKQIVVTKTNILCVFNGINDKNNL